MKNHGMSTRVFGIRLRRNLEFESAVQDEIARFAPNKIPIIISVVPYVQTGWGVFTVNLVHQMLSSTRFHPIIKPEGCSYVLNRNQVPGNVWKLHDRQRAIRATICNANWERVHTLVPYPVIHAVNGGFNGAKGEADTTPLVWGHRNVGVVFMEKASLNAHQAARAVAYDAIVAGSSWNAMSLATSIERFGYPIRVPNRPRKCDRDIAAADADVEGVEIHAVLQGVNTRIFSSATAVVDKDDDTSIRIDPALRRKLERPGAFVVFAGGAFSFRKGHDLIVKAFADFVKRFPNAILVTAWVNLLAETRPNLQEQIAENFQLSSTSPNDLSSWLVERGISKENHHALGLVSHREIAEIFRYCHAALFANRAEGGTNLPAMEAMASGIPTILSANSGHLDLIR
eukprot:g4149.t1